MPRTPPYPRPVEPIGSLPRRLTAYALLAVLLLVVYYLTTMEHTIYVADNFVMTNTHDGYDLRMGQKGARSIVVSGVERYAVAEDAIVGESADGWFIVDVRRGKRLTKAGLPEREIEAKPWLPPFKTFAPDRMEAWQEALQSVGIDPGVRLSPPSRWHAPPSRWSWIGWAVVFFCWLAWYLITFRRPRRPPTVPILPHAPNRDDHDRRGPTA